MKKEKGSALLTVVLIASVTATIGVAISSFILMNYRLRLYDTHVRRAEYAAEEIVDKTYLYVQEYCYNTFKNMAEKAQSDVSEEYNNEKDAEGVELVYWTIDEHGEYKLKTEKVVKVARENYKDEFDNLCGEFKNKIVESLNDKNIINDSEIEIKEDKNIISNGTIEINFEKCVKNDEGKFTQPLKISYKIPKNAVIKSNPVVKFSVDIIIARPEYEDVINTSYDIRNYVGISNWSIDNNWNI